MKMEFLWQQDRLIMLAAITSTEWIWRILSRAQTSFLDRLAASALQEQSA